MDLRTRLDREIKKAWADIRDDYYGDFLLQEDCLKNALYYHIRRRLGDSYFRAQRIRVFTEFHSSNRQRADIAAVRLLPRRDMEVPWYGITDRVDDVLAIIECKFKSEDVPLDPFCHDVEKVGHLTSLSKYRDSLFYLAFLHEATFEPENLSMLSERQKTSWASGRVAELVGCFVTGEKKMHFEVISHNDLNPRIHLKLK